ncbi:MULTISPECIES: diacylglycerol/lipid kinase family protein [Arthrobacter]|uniref:Diacylglycerol kinase family lipid kinase n=1 Tax=Arthrobacter caoxuetaonis TaxID=2886935 RepID=A0A9X1SCY0_9MICC|nr:MULTISPECIES: diacylglycerol kinase family protein [Arthrobacter]MCC3281698.1 diacylglycerol kinase family lipid kinase [Arthrobacter caoxuetaonis]MCC3298633.1 diacylglycerol kinase family lipid kinase [Arthrobacter caoxuetaonis]MCC9194859.1 diacylglycerol kinase family lipid kinase [Arthrobacter sp. zg-Y916]USQ57374.1 diacylglycerol kinase family lipid kinase [Arthrobacter caoxuetaonis]
MPAEIAVILLLTTAVIASVSTWQVMSRRERRLLAARVTRPVAAADQRVAMVINPIKSQADSARTILAAACEIAGWEPPLIFETTVESPGHQQAQQALEAGADVVLAAGGDGTVREVARALANAPAAMGLIPLGTGNLLARNLGLPLNDLAGSVQAALHGSERRIDMGRLVLEDARTGARSTSNFLVMGGIGLDAEVIAATRDELKRRVGWLAYSEAGVRLMPGPRRRMRIQLDDEPAQVRKVRSVLFANTGRLPAGIDFIPSAAVDDGMLDIVVLSPRTVLGWAAVVGKIVTRNRRDLPLIEYRRARRVTVSTEEPTITQLDGDLTGAATSVSVTVDPRCLRVRAADPQPPGGGAGSTAAASPARSRLRRRPPTG